MNTKANLDQYYDILGSVANEYGVPPAIHPEDMIFQFLLEHPCFIKKDDALEYYFRDGKKSAIQLKEICHYMNPSDTPRRILEFACGYGCVTRHMGSVFKGSEITCSDIHPQAMEFITKNLGMQNCQLSATNPEEFECSGYFDVVFALSFFSHMPARTWKKWLSRLYNLLEPGGLLIFTTQGLYSRQYFGNPTIPQNGFWFFENSEQKDLSVSDYGQTIVTVDFVHKAIQDVLGSKLSLFREAYWWGHQDLYVVRQNIGN